MGLRTRARDQVERGDFQTPPALAAEVCRLLAARRLDPRSIVEPTCGAGSLLLAALDAFPRAARALGADLDPRHLRALRAALRRRPDAARVTVRRRDFFTADWARLLAELPTPILVVGNPPWVTSADLGALGSGNLPARSNFHGRAGLDALTGKSNFDISEWMLIALLRALAGRAATLAMLCKASVARRVLEHGWRAGLPLRAAATYRIDAAAHFGAAVDACLLVCELGARAGDPVCPTFASLAAARPTGALGYRDGLLLADVARYERWKHLAAAPAADASPYRWRSGVKHDCARVMELRPRGDRYENGAGERVALEPELVYPLLKGAEVARGGAAPPGRVVLVPQRTLGEPTAHLERAAPLAWRYLARHRAALDGRKSSIYRGKPPFSLFGVGDYTFAPWKVAISGLHKRLAFRIVGPHEGRPVVLDDTCYFLPCRSEAEARALAALLASEPAQELYTAFVFWDAKRPITIELLRRLDLARLAQALGHAGELSPAGAPSDHRPIV